MGSKLSYKEQLKCIVQISLAFMMIFTAFKPLENVMTKLYEDMGHSDFGEISLAILYFCFAFSTAFTSSVINSIGFKLTFICAAFFFLCFDASGFVIAEYTTTTFEAWVVLILASVMGGVANSFIWIAQGMYVGQFTTLQYRDEMFGIFWGIRNIGSVMGYVLTTFLLGQAGL